MKHLWPAGVVVFVMVIVATFGVRALAAQPETANQAVSADTEAQKETQLQPEKSDTGDTTPRQAVSELDTIVVTATKTSKKLANVPAVVNIIGPDQIKQMPAQTVGDLLADIPGVMAYQPQGVGVVTPQMQRIRGDAFGGHTQLLLDGQPINTPFTDYGYITTIPLRAVERIEVIRGPFSALYGSSATAGIINVITKAGSDRPAVEVFGETGDFNRWNGGGSAQVSGRLFSLGVFYDHMVADNYWLYNDHNVDTRNRDYFHDRFHGKWEGSIGSHTVYSLSGGTLSAETGFGLSPQLDLRKHLDLEQTYLNFHFGSQLLDNLELLGRADWIGARHTYFGETLVNVTYPKYGPPIPNFNYRASKNFTDSQRSRGEITLNYAVAPNHILTMGVQAVYTEAEKSIRDCETEELLQVQGRQGEQLREDSTSESVYLQYDWLLGDRYELLLGGRFDNYDTYGRELTPKATFRWNYRTDGNLKFSVAKGFRAPNLNELYSPPWTMAPFIVYQGNEDLEAETLWSYEVSLEQYALDQRLSFRVTPYYTKGKDFITSVRRPDPMNPKMQIMHPENINEVEIKGVETEMTFTPVEFLTLFANYTYNETLDGETGNILDGYPKHTGALGARGNYSINDNWSLFGYFSDRYYGAYTSSTWGSPPVVETVAKYWWATGALGLSWKNRITLKGQVFNLFNDRSKLEVERYIPERNFLVELSLRATF